MRDKKLSFLAKNRSPSLPPKLSLATKSPRANLLVFLFGLGCSFFLLLLAEAGIRWFWDGGLALEWAYEDEYFHQDEHGINRPLPKGRYRSSLRSKKTGLIIYDVVYTIDSLSRRMTLLESTQMQDKFLLFFGGSFVYGEGVSDQETLPYEVGAQAPVYRPYNYAFHGHGPNELLAKLESRTLREEIGEKKGILIYVFIDGHVHRAVGTFRVSTTWGKHSPYYELDEAGVPRRKGSFHTGRGWLQHFYEALAKIELFRFLSLDLPLRFSDRHLDFVACILARAKQEFELQFPESNFYVIIYPGSKLGGRLKNFLNEKKVSVLDYSRLFDANDPRFILFSEDPHPSPLAYRTLAQQIVRDLRLGH